MALKWGRGLLASSKPSVVARRPSVLAFVLAPTMSTIVPTCAERPGRRGPSSGSGAITSSAIADTEALLSWRRVRHRIIRAILF
jgi:hypothetical protein